jgi:hypothetical protein
MDITEDSSINVYLNGLGLGSIAVLHEHSRAIDTNRVAPCAAVVCS